MTFQKQEFSYEQRKEIAEYTKTYTQDETRQKFGIANLRITWARREFGVIPPRDDAFECALADVGKGIPCSEAARRQGISADKLRRMVADIESKRGFPECLKVMGKVTGFEWSEI